MRNEQLRQAKATLRGFFAAQDSAYLTRVADECRSGEFAFTNACHCIRGLTLGGYDTATSAAYLDAEQAAGLLAGFAMYGTFKLFNNDIFPLFKPELSCGSEQAKPFDALARARVLPLVLAEIRRRTAPRVIQDPAFVMEQGR